MKRRTILIASAAPLLALSLACGTGGTGVDVPAGSVRRTSHLSLARFGGQECIRREAIAVMEREGTDDIVLMESEPGRPNEVQITSCDDLVASFAPLARCVVTAPLPIQDDPRVSEALIQATRYIFTSARVQRARRECATLGGQWSASTAPEPSRRLLRRRVRDLARAYEALH